MKRILVAIFIFAFLFSALLPSGALAKKKHKTVHKAPALEQEQPAAVSDTKDRFKGGKRLKYVSPPTDITIESIPLTLPIPDEAIAALAKGKVDVAIRELRSNPPSARSIRMLKDAQKVEKFKKHKEEPKFEQHQFYQNLGIAYHNLFLFVKRNNQTYKDYYKKALKYYEKAEKASTSDADKSEVQILIASLRAANDETEAAQKIFSEADPSLIMDRYRGIEYVAGYYAAMGDAKSAMEKLIVAYALDPNETVIWVAISDDFYKIENDPDFKEMAGQWTSAYKKKVEKKNLQKLKKAAEKAKKASKRGKKK